MRTIKTIREDLEKRGYTFNWNDVDANDDYDNRVSYNVHTPSVYPKDQGAKLEAFKKKYPTPPIYSYANHKAFYAYYDKLDKVKAHSLVSASINSNSYCCAYDDFGGFFRKNKKGGALLKEWCELVMAKNRKLKFLNTGVPLTEEYDWIHKPLMAAGFTRVTSVPTRHSGEKYEVAIYIWVRKPSDDAKELLKEIKTDAK